MLLRKAHDIAARTSLEGERTVVAMVLRQAIIDLGSARQAIREEAARFFTDRETLPFWCSLGGLDTDAFAARVEALQRLREAQ
jgi:hypothetical protein